MRGLHRRNLLSRLPGEPIGVVLAGGRGRRMGGSKATVELGGRPLIAYPLAAMAGALSEVVVLAKADTALPNLPGATVWIEPHLHHHPVVGIQQALALAAGRPVVICAGDLPFVGEELLRRLASEKSGGAPALLAADRGQMQPLLGRYEPQALALLRSSPLDSDAPVREHVRMIGARLLEVDDPEMLFNVNAPEDLLRAAAILDRRQAPAGVRRLR